MCFASRIRKFPDALVVIGPERLVGNSIKDRDARAVLLGYLRCRCGLRVSKSGDSASGCARM